MHRTRSGAASVGENSRQKNGSANEDVASDYYFLVVDLTVGLVPGVVGREAAAAASAAADIPLFFTTGVDEAEPAPEAAVAVVVAIDTRGVVEADPGRATNFNFLAKHAITSCCEMPK